MVSLSRMIVVVGLATVCLGDSLRSQSTDWPQFLGTNRDGVANESGLAKTIPPQGLEVLWRVPAGVGMSAVAVKGKYAVTMWNSDDGQVVAAIDSQQGRLLWKSVVAPNYENGQGNGPRATPTIQDDHVYAYTGQGVLACLNLTDGRVVWSNEIVRSLRLKPADYGMSSSPLVVDDLVIVTAGGSGSTVVAVDQASGQIQWTAGDGAPGYSSPVQLTIDDSPQVVAFVGSGLLGFEPSTGKQLWQYPFRTDYDCNTASPILIGNDVFISAGENHGCAKLQITRDGDQYVVTELWDSVDVTKLLRNEWQTSVLVDGYLYGFDNVGSAGPTTHLKCVDAATGRLVWTENRFGKGNLVAADGRLWIMTMKGELVLVDATPEGFRELGRQPLCGKTRQSLSIASGKGYLRDDSEVICVDLSL